MTVRQQLLIPIMYACSILIFIMMDIAPSKFDHIYNGPRLTITYLMAGLKLFPIGSVKKYST